MAVIHPIHKEGDKKEVKNYRGVVLRFCLEKNNKIGESQAGFRKRRGTRNHIFVLNSLINSRIKRKKGKMYACFIDFRTAFDSVNRETMIKKFKKNRCEGQNFKGNRESI